MSVNHLIVFPDESTFQFFDRIFKECPFELDLLNLRVEIGSSTSAIRTKAESRLYNAAPGSMNVWYDSALGESNILIPLFPSKKMAQRHDEVGDAWSRPLFRPFINLGICPPLRRRTVRAWINSISTELVDTCPVLSFHGESVLTDEAQVPDNSDFYTDYVEMGAVSDQVLLELDEGIE